MFYIISFQVQTVRDLVLNNVNMGRSPILCLSTGLSYCAGCVALKRKTAWSIHEFLQVTGKIARTIRNYALSHSFIRLLRLCRNNYDVTRCHSGQQFWFDTGKIDAVFFIIICIPYYQYWMAILYTFTLQERMDRCCFCANCLCLREIISRCICLFILS